MPFYGVILSHGVNLKIQWINFLRLNVFKIFRICVWVYEVPQLIYKSYRNGLFYVNNNENVHRFVLRAIRLRGELLEREREKERERSTQFVEGSINGPSNRRRVGLTLKLDALL